MALRRRVWIIGANKLWVGFNISWIAEKELHVAVDVDNLR